MPDHHVKISGKSDHHALQNLSSNPTANFSESQFFEISVNPLEIISGERQA
jgi:hypothetical protein